MPPRLPQSLTSLLALTLLVALTLAACASQDRISTSGCVIEIEHLADLGEFDDPVSITGTDFVTVARAPGIGWVVVDRMGAAQLIAYHPDGKFRGLLGKVGPGPMEFSRPEAVALDHSDSLWVSDTRDLIVLDREGVPARSARLTGDFRADGFDSQGRPYTVRSRMPIEERERRPPLPYVVHLTRDGVPVDSSGPGLGPDAQEHRVVHIPASTTALLDDSTVVTTLHDDDDKTWLEYWRGTESAPWVSAAEILAALGQPSSAISNRLLRNSDVYADGSGGIWNTATLRTAPGEAGSGRLIHLDATGAVTGVATFAGQPLQFIDREHLASTYEDPNTGLIVIRIYRLSRSCGD